MPVDGVITKDELKVKYQEAVDELASYLEPDRVLLTGRFVAVGKVMALTDLLAGLGAEEQELENARELCEKATLEN